MVTQAQLEQALRQNPGLLDQLVPRLNRYIPHYPHPPQAAFLLVNHVREVFYGGSAGGGKRIVVQEAVPTPLGWTTMGQLRPGDFVFDEFGHPTEVLAVSEVAVGPSYQLTFDIGAPITCDEGHLWRTLNRDELTQNYRRTPEFRERRQASRPSRVAGNKSAVFEVSLAVANSLRHYEVLGPTTGTIRTAKELYETQSQGHTIPIPAALDLPEMPLPVDPYILGMWLGDGTTGTGKFCSADPELVAAYAAAGYQPRHYSSGRSIDYTTTGLSQHLAMIRVRDWKHIPKEYLRASYSQRLALLQGLLDTDGHCNAVGQCDISSSYPALAEGIHDLIRGLGIKVNPRQKQTYLNGVPKRVATLFKFSTILPVFRLPRKFVKLPTTIDSQSTRIRLRNIWPVPGTPMVCIQVANPTGMFLVGRSMIPTHNSDALLMGALQYVDTPGYAALLLRNTFADLSLPDAIMERARSWLSDTDAHWNDRDHTWTFPSGAKLAFGYIEHESDKWRYKSAAFQYIGFDELTHFSESQYRFMFSRLRRLIDSQVPVRMRSASNPGGPGHDWVKRRFLIEGAAKGRLFIPARLEDNPSLDQADYDESLAELDPITRAQMRGGNWDAKPLGKKFDRTTIPVVDIAPSVMRTVRYWDLASTAEAQDPDSDRTVGLKLGWDYHNSKKFYVLDVVKGRLAPHQVEALVKQVALLDGRETMIRIEQDPGQAGVAQVNHYVSTVLPGYNTLGIRHTGDKDTRSAAVAAACAMGNVLVLNGPWTNDLLDELEEFPYGARDDQVDTLSGAHSVITNLDAQARVIHINRRRA